MKLKVNIYHSLLSFLLVYLLLVCFFPILNATFLHCKDLLSGLFLLFTAILFFNVNKNVLVPLILIGGYIFYSLVIITNSSVNIKDYLTVFLAFVYLFLLAFFIGKKKINIVYFNRFLFGILLIFGAKYLLLKLIYHDPRPILFIENNFELLFIGILMIGYMNFNEKINFWYLILFAIISFLSGSRSGMGIFVFIVISAFFKKEYLKLKYLWIYLLLFAGIFIGYLKFLERIPEGGIMQIDRLRFLTYFLFEIKDWGLKEYLFGMPIITPLSDYTCEGLKYYKELYSYSGNAICYSVILHSFVLRVIFDHGLLGLFFIFGILAFMLRKSGFKLRYVVSVIGVLLLNSLSISSINSIFAVFALSVVMQLSTEKATIQKFNPS